MTTKTPAVTAALAALTEAVEAAAATWTGLDWDMDDSDDSDVSVLAKHLERRGESGEALPESDYVESISSWGPADGGHRAQQHQNELRSLARRIAQGVSAEDMAEVAANARTLADEAERYVETQATDAAESGREAVALATAGNLAGAREALERACSIERNYGDSPAWGAALAALAPLEALATAEEEATDAAGYAALAAAVHDALDRSPVGYDALRAGGPVLADWALQEGLMVETRSYGLCLSHPDSDYVLTLDEVREALSA